MATRWFIIFLGLSIAGVASLIFVATQFNEPAKNRGVEVIEQWEQIMTCPYMRTIATVDRFDDDEWIDMILNTANLSKEDMDLVTAWFYLKLYTCYW